MFNLSGKSYIVFNYFNIYLKERERNIVFAPCGHLCICTECFLSNNITTCPMDRRGIESTVTVYF